MSDEDFCESLNDFEKKGDYEAMERLISQKLNREPDNFELHVRFALLEYSVPIMDYFKAIESLQRARSICKQSTLPLMLEAYIHHFSLGGIPATLMGELESFSEVDNEVLAIIQLVKSWYYEQRDQELYVECLENSIKYCDKHVWSMVYLAKYFVDIGNVGRSTQLLTSAIDNVELIYSPNSNFSVTDSEEFINERFKGIHMTSENFEYVKSLQKTQ